MTQGWVYVLASRSKPGIVKIGRTTRAPSERVRQLDVTRGYASFGPWDEVWSIPVLDCPHVEAAAHRRLAHRRVRLRYLQCRELFRVSPDEACRVVRDAACTRRPRFAPRRGPWRRRQPTGRFMNAAVSLAIGLGLLWALAH